MLLKILTFLSACAVLCYANPLLNLNVEERIAYDLLESSPKSKHFHISIRPFSNEKAYIILDNPLRIKAYMNSLSEPGYYIKPVNSITLQTFYTTEEKFNLENMGGTLIEKGLNIYTFLDGYVSVGRRFVFYYQFRYLSNKQNNKLDIYRTYAKLRIGKFSFQVGKDSVHLGPGEFSLLLSANAEPFPMIKIQTEESINFAGKWNFLFVRGWLREKRSDVDNPNILALRVVWKPWDFIEIGGTRTALYGGEGRPGFKLTEYSKLIIGTEENVPSSKFNADGYGAWDVSIYLPVHRWFPTIKMLKLYYQEAGTDITAWWQKEDRGEFKPPFGFNLLNRGVVVGLLMSTSKDIIRLEFNRVGDLWYKHALYPIDGYTYKGLSLGHPYGPNMVHLFFKHRRYIDNYTSLMYKVGFYRQPYEGSPLKMTRYYLVVSPEKRIDKFIVSGFVRIDFTRNYDADQSPLSFSITPEDKTLITGGLSVSWRI